MQSETISPIAPIMAEIAPLPAGLGSLRVKVQGASLIYTNMRYTQKSYNQLLK
jgi:hypothetical protein